MDSDNFFKEQTEQSEIKSQIVANYFNIWAKIMAQTKTARIGYIDLFSGPGVYQDGSESTPLKILNRAIDDPVIARKLQCYFNDKDRANIDRLKSVILDTLDISKLKYPPSYMSEEVGDQLIEWIGKIGPIPSFLFIDPWGYKGLSLRLIQSVIQNWGAECMFFFNYNRINAAITNEVLYKHVADMFGNTRALDLQDKIKWARAGIGRESVVMEEITEAMHDIGGKYILTFRFKTRDGRRTSHYLIFVTKNFKGFDLMKKEMAKKSYLNQDGTYSFEYSPLPSKGTQQGWLLGPARPLEKLGEDLLKAYAGKQITMGNLYMDHSVHTKFIDRDYKKALKKLADDGKIFAPARKKGSFGDDVLIHFPAID